MVPCLLVSLVNGTHDLMNCADLSVCPVLLINHITSHGFIRKCEVGCHMSLTENASPSVNSRIKTNFFDGIDLYKIIEGR